MKHYTRAQLSKKSKNALISMIMLMYATGMLKMRRFKHRRKHRGLHGRALRRHKRGKGGKGHRYSVGVHHKRIRGKMRKFRVLANGQWRFMKG